MIPAVEDFTQKLHSAKARVLEVGPAHLATGEKTWLACERRLPATRRCLVNQWLLVKHKLCAHQVETECLRL